MWQFSLLILNPLSWRHRILLVLNARLFLHVSRNVHLVQKKVLKGCCSNRTWLYLGRKTIWGAKYYLDIVMRMWPYFIAHLVHAVKYSPGIKSCSVEMERNFKAIIEFFLIQLQNELRNCF